MLDNHIQSYLVPIIYPSGADFFGESIKLSM